MAATSSSSPTRTYDLDTATQSLRDRLQGAYEAFENDPDLEVLQSELVYIRDRAETLRDVAAKMTVALSDL